uniref:Ribosomal protein S6 kinase polypeptide 1 n=1 Tax=Gouania willdenowi TaxID=441366 RepID=A0A8C5HD30_GOUWI
MMISQRDIDELARFYTVTDPKKHNKGYTVYKVTARIISRKNPEDIQEITVWKRYSDFRKLHQNLWQLHKNTCSHSELFPPFAKAKVFGRFDDSVIEQRRQCSEDLLQFSANIPALYNSPHIQDFFKGGDFHDGSELIGPAEPFSEFLAESLSDCSSDSPSSESDLTSSAVDTDSLVGLDDGMASGRTSPNQPHGGAISSSCSPHLPVRHSAHTSPAPVPKPEVNRPSLPQLFSGSWKNSSGGSSKQVKSDYLDRASELICLAVQKEQEEDYQAALVYYRCGVDLLLQGVQGEPSAARREAVKKKTAEYLMRAEQLSCQQLLRVLQSPSEELCVYRVLGVIDKVGLLNLLLCPFFKLQGLRKSSDCGRSKRTIMPRSVPHMVQLKKIIISEDTVFLLLQYAEGGKLWSHIGKYLHTSSPDESFDIPFIQKSHTTAVHSSQHSQHAVSLLEASSLDSRAGIDHDSVSRLQKEAEDVSVAPKSAIPPRLVQRTGSQSLESGATSEEECTNSYLTLCNEYEQDKVEPDALEEEEDRSEQLSLDQEHSEVFSPLPSPPAPQSLDQSKHTLMEFFRIDSRDSASEVTCLDVGEQHSSKKHARLFSTSDLGSDVTEDFPELAQEAKGWGLDYSDKCSNESVPVISFKEAAVEDEGHPPDLLVNLPVVSGAESLRDNLPTSGVCLGLEVTQPDVLQLLSQSEEEEQPAKEDISSACATSATCETDVASSLFPSLWDNYTQTFGKQASEVRVHPEIQNSEPGLNEGLPINKPSCSEIMEASSKVNTDSLFHPGGCTTGSIPALTQSEACAAPQGLLGPDCESSPVISTAAGNQLDKEVSRLFAELDELSLAASQARIPEEFVRCWAVELVTALDSLHQEGIICRDLNPNNILLDHRGHVQLTYFSCWSDVEESCDKEAIANMYCAPEVGGIGEETASCDWWSLGAILFELLTCTSLLRCHPARIGRHTTLNISESVSEEARSLLEQLLQYNPTERLGAGVGGVEDIKAHPFFAKVDWPKP